MKPPFDRWLGQLAARLVRAIEAVPEAARRRLELEPLTFAELGRRRADRWPEPTRPRSAIWAPWASDDPARPT